MASLNFNIQFNSFPHSPKLHNLTGQKFGRLLVIAFYDRLNGNVRWLCLCDCKQITVVHSMVLRRKRGTRSCGCWKREEAQRRYTTHGERHSAEYLIYHDAKKRCNNPRSTGHKHYGGRGIKFLYSSVEEFLADVGRRPSPKHSLDRIDVNGNYEAGNCRWATKSQQARNTRQSYSLTVGDVTRNVGDWADDSELDTHTIYTRSAVYGWCDDCSVLKPRRAKCPHKT